MKICQNLQHFWADSEYLGKINTKKEIQFFFQCLALPKDPQSFGSQNLRCPFSVSQYYRRQRLCCSKVNKKPGMAEGPKKSISHKTVEACFQCSGVPSAIP